MPYGRPPRSRHGYHAPRYVWQPDFLPPSRRRKRRRPPQSTPSRRRGRPGWLLQSEEVLSFLVYDVLLSEERCPDWFVKLCYLMPLIGVLLHWESWLFLVCFGLFLRHIDKIESAAEKQLLMERDEATTAIRINRKTSVSPPPTAEALRGAWKAAREGLPGKLLAGTLLSDLEPVVDQSYIRDEDGTIVGRRPGIKGWLLANCPDMLPHYKALMSYKALADKLRKALGVEEPDTLAGVLDFVGGTQTEETTEKTPGRRGGIPKSLQLLNEFKLLKSNGEHVANMYHEIIMKWTGTKGPGTMAALDAVLRERLGVVWMRRAKRRRVAV